MSDLFTQLRAYGRQIQGEGYGHARPLNRPPQRDNHDDPPADPRPTRGDAPGSTPRPGRGRTRRPALLVAAATAAITVASTLVLSAVPNRSAPPLDQGGDMPTSSVTRTAVVTTFCALIASCSTTTIEGSESAVASSSSVSAIDPPRLFDTAGPVEPGAYLIDELSSPIRITVPAGWSTSGDFFLIAGDGANHAAFIAFWNVRQVHPNACVTVPTTMDTNIPSSAIVEGLLNQRGTDATEPKTVQLDGVTATHLVISKSPDTVPEACMGQARLIADAEGDAFISSDFPGERWEFYVFDLPGGSGVITVAHPEQMDTALRAQVDAMLASLDIR